jgi:multidrug efflux pump subunit AcrA (membrane-fusion protein)
MVVPSAITPPADRSSLREVFMTAALDQPPLPQLRDGLTIRAVSPREYIVKRHDRREYFSLGEREAFLLQQLDGQATAGDICERYEVQFRETLSPDDLASFLETVRPLGLFRGRTSAGPESRPRDATQHHGAEVPHKSQSPATGADRASESTSGSEFPGSRRKPKLRDQSLLFFRIPLCNPDQFLQRLVSWTPFVWTRGFLIVLCGLLTTAFCVLTANAGEVAASLPVAPGWRDLARLVLVVGSCTALHEMAHGATLKRFGGEVHDAGVLLMFFTPCMYCNVSDAWLLPEKWKRLAVTAAGGLCDLLLWSLGVFAWRITVPGTLIHHLALLTLTFCGGRSLLNFNPLLRLDGYYLLSDWLSIPNLRPRALEYWMAHVRWLLWGAARPPSVPGRRVFLLYGGLCWVFAIGFLDLILVQVFEYLGGQFGVAGLLLVLLLAGVAMRRVFRGFFSSELGTMMTTRSGRTAAWAAGLMVAAVLLFAVPVRSTINGEFEVRPGHVEQINVPVSGVLEELLVDDGSPVTAGQVLAVLRSAELESEILRSGDLLIEVTATLKRLKAGARPEEIALQREEVRRAQEWYELGVAELRQYRAAYDQERLIQTHRQQELRAELDNARQNLSQSVALYEQGALAGAQLRAERLQLLQLESRLAQNAASVAAAEAVGLQTREAEVSRRLQDLEAQQDKLELIEAGSRPEDIAAEEARLARVEHELNYLRSQQSRLKIVATVDGLFVAPRVREKLGLATLQGSQFGTIEQPGTSHLEIHVSEDDAAHVKPGQTVRLKARAIPFESFEATVESVSATASRTGNPGLPTVIVHCQVTDPDGRLKSGMTGFGRIMRGWNTMGLLLVTRGLKYLRTEFWW